MKYNNINYSGKIQDKQINGEIKYQKIDYQPVYSDYQNFLYHRALKGLDVYTIEEVNHMRPDKVRRIQHVHRRTRAIVNVWKQEIINVMCARLFMDFFPARKNKMTRDMIETVDDVDPEYNPPFTLRELGVTKDMLIQKLFQERILPRDFYELR